MLAESRSPRWSVLMPAYNAEHTVTGSVRSALAQTVADIEVVVIDDGSTDGTAAAVEAIKDPRLRLIRHPHNLGLVAALNTGLSEARAPLIARLDADDTSRPERLERQGALFDADPTLVLAACAHRRQDPDGVLLRQGCPPLDDGALRVAMLLGNRINHSTAAFRRQAALDVGGYDAEWFPAEDYDLWLRLLVVGTYAGVADELTCTVNHPEGVSMQHAERQQERVERRAAMYRASIASEGRGPADPGGSATRAIIELRRSLGSSGRLTPAARWQISTTFLASIPATGRWKRMGLAARRSPFLTALTLCERFRRTHGD